MQILEHKSKFQLNSPKMKHDKQTINLFLQWWENPPLFIFAMVGKPTIITSSLGKPNTVETANVPAADWNIVKVRLTIYGL